MMILMKLLKILMWILAGIINNKIEENVKSKDIINLNDISDNSFVKIVNNVHNKNNENNLNNFKSAIRRSF